MFSKPNLQCGPFNVTPEAPSDFSLPVLSGGVEVQSLNGTQLKDIPWRKYQYILTWEAMTEDDFILLQKLINYHNDFGVAIAFQYSRFNQSESIVYCTAQFLGQKAIGTHLAPACYNNVTLTLTEQDPRAMVS